MTAAELLARDADPDRDAIRRAVSGNLCRCTGYHKIVDAVEEAAHTMRAAQEDK
jgi:carbon-monoxide dehydrogenase small subunit